MLPGTVHAGTRARASCGRAKGFSPTRRFHRAPPPPHPGPGQAPAPLPAAFPPAPLSPALPRAGSRRGAAGARWSQPAAPRFPAASPLRRGRPGRAAGGWCLCSQPSPRQRVGLPVGKLPAGTSPAFRRQQRLVRRWLVSPAAEGIQREDEV